jgi:hypothetical protein
VILHLFILTLILHFLNHGSNFVMALLNLFAAKCMLPDRPVIFVSSAYIEMATLLSFSADDI